MATQFDSIAFGQATKRLGSEMTVGVIDLVKVLDHMRSRLRQTTLLSTLSAFAHLGLTELARYKLRQQPATKDRGVHRCSTTLFFELLWHQSELLSRGLKQRAYHRWHSQTLTTRFANG